MCCIENRCVWKDFTPHLMVWHHFYKNWFWRQTIPYRNPKNPTVQSLFVPSKHTIFVYCTAVVSCMPLHPTVGVRRRSRSEPHNACVLQSSDSGHAGAADWNSRSEEFARQISFLHESLGLSEEASRSWSRYSSQVPDSTDPNVRLRVEGELKEWSDAARALTRRKPGAIEMPELRRWGQVQKWPQWRAVQKAVPKLRKACKNLLLSFDLGTKLERYRKRLLQSAGANESSGVGVCMQSMSWQLHLLQASSQSLHSWLSWLYISEIFWNGSVRSSWWKQSLGLQRSGFSEWVLSKKAYSNTNLKTLGCIGCIGLLNVRSRKSKESLWQDLQQVARI